MPAINSESTTSVEVPAINSESTTAVEVPAIDSDSTTVEVTAIGSESTTVEVPASNINGFFEVLFLSKKKSMYSSIYSFATNLTQESVLAHHLHDDIERMMEVRDALEEAEGKNVLFEDNPLQLGFYLDCVYASGSRFNKSYVSVNHGVFSFIDYIQFIDHTNNENGDVKYCVPKEGNQ